MPVTPPGPLTRTNYLSWPPGPYNAQADPNSASYDPSLVLPLDGFPNYGDSALDSEQYFRSLERLHGMGLHAPGVASGMQIATKTGSPGVQIMPGTALDASGKHIFLAQGGQAEIGPDADVPDTPPVLVPVSASGVTLPTAGYTGTYFVVVQWWETWSSSSYASDPNVQQYADTPWLQLVTAAEVNPDVHVVLGQVALDGGSNVTAANYGVVGGTQRTNVSIPVQSVQLQRASNAGSSGAQSSAWGVVRARESGGIEIVTANTGDEINLITQGGGNFSSMAIGTNKATVGTTSNPGIVLNGQEATVQVGAPGNYGDVIVYDGNGHLSVTLIGDTGHVIVGGPTLNGEVRMLDSNANETMTLEGNTGSAVVQNLTAYSNNTINVNTTFLRCHGTDFCLDGRSHNNNRALVDLGDQLIINFNNDYPNGVIVEGTLQAAGTLTDGNGVPLMGNPARKIQTWFLLAGASDFGNWGGSNTHEFSFSGPTQLTACASLNFLQEYVSVSYNAAACAEIYEVDGSGTGQIINGNGILGNVNVPIWNGAATTVTFRARAGDDSMAIAANCIVYYE